MTDWLALGADIVRGDSSRPASAYRRLLGQIASDGGQITLSDHDLVLAAREAVEQDRPLTARVALDELHLRMTADDPVRGVAA